MWGLQRCVQKRLLFLRGLPFIISRQLQPILQMTWSASAMPPTVHRPFICRASVLHLACIWLASTLLLPCTCYACGMHGARVHLLYSTRQYCSRRMMLTLRVARDLVCRAIRHKKTYAICQPLQFTESCVQCCQASDLTYPITLWTNVVYEPSGPSIQSTLQPWPRLCAFYPLFPHAGTFCTCLVAGFHQPSVTCHPCRFYQTAL